ncbi:protein N-terminal glutamine amidohydrolase [Iris pallida]|uniref:Protein N-terminal glutamine amidohydrolase n=1 Tax=Iris pallida TaxID=29817 RepID=A0AAX6E0T4_IRIPA|nr:protein N-terminal glutamine amidohydrolase [Iris pallida]KAJ6845817.1 protein N-terminal glutamine amidohydrolase [Iris pallida]
MAGKGEVAEEAAQGSNDAPPYLSSFTHTPFYCEENVYFLCKKLCMLGIADEKGADLFVVFISNEERKIPMWYQKASKQTDGLVIWDYHVICIQSQKSEQGIPHYMVWDLDSSLPCPLPLNEYFGKAILAPFALDPTYNRLFRVVHAPSFLQWFASDRSHMKDPLGNWVSPPPMYKPVVAEDGTKNNLDEYIRMSDADVVTGKEASTAGVYSNKFGVVISEMMLEDFFSQIQH